MAEVNMTKAKAVYSKILKMLDSKDWKYERHDEDLVIKSGVRCEDLPVEFIIRVLPEPEVVQFVSPMSYKVPEDKRLEGAVAVSVANYGLINGSFDYDVADGEIRFRLTSSYLDSEIGEGLLEYMMMVGVTTTDRYNDKFFMLTKGMLTLQQFIEQERS